MQPDVAAAKTHCALWWVTIVTQPLPLITTGPLARPGPRHHSRRRERPDEDSREYVPKRGAERSNAAPREREKAQRSTPCQERDVDTTTASSEGDRRVLATSEHAKRKKASHTHI